MSIKILTYIGTVLIAFEFVREFTDFQNLAGMSINYPFVYITKNWDKFSKRLSFFKIPLAILIFIMGVCVTLVMLPFAMLYGMLWFIIFILDLFNRWVNEFYSRRWAEYSFLVKPVIHVSLGKHDDHRTHQRVQEKMEKSSIRIIPIIGLILLTIAFVLEFVH
jgi:hypothetical protein